MSESQSIPPVGHRVLGHRVSVRHTISQQEIIVRSVAEELQRIATSKAVDEEQRQGLSNIIVNLLSLERRLSALGAEFPLHMEIEE